MLAKLVHAVAPDNAEEVAARLLERFGSLGAVLSAPARALNSATDLPSLAMVLHSARIAVLESLREEVRGAPFDPGDQRILTYLVARMQGEAEEHLHAIFLDARRCYILDQRMASGSWNRISVQLRPIMRLALEIDAAFIVLLHNHPSGNPKPSSADIQFTVNVQTVSRILGIELFDHLIVAGPSLFSMRAAGLLA